MSAHDDYLDPDKYNYAENEWSDFLDEFADVQSRLKQAENDIEKVIIFLEKQGLK